MYLKILNLEALVFYRCVLCRIEKKNLHVCLAPLGLIVSTPLQILSNVLLDTSAQRDPLLRYRNARFITNHKCIYISRIIFSSEKNSNQFLSPLEISLS